ncbi:MAG: outer membrane protein assembly factor BamB family protein [Actinomycetota bacterium]
MGRDPATGSVRWTADSRGEAVAAVDGVAFVGSGDDLTALNARTGAARWTVHLRARNGLVPIGGTTGGVPVGSA